MDDNQYVAPAAPILPDEVEAAGEHPVEDEPAPPGRTRSAWRGAKIGVRLVSYVIGPFAAVFLVPGLALTAFGLGSGRGFGVHRIVVSAAGIYVIFALPGAAVGATIALLSARIRVSQPGSRRAAWWAAMKRPIRLHGDKSESAISVTSRPGHWRRLRPWLVWGTLVILASILVAAFATGAYVGRVVDRRLARAIASADADDPNWQVDDLFADRESVPDEENSALVVAEVVSSLPENWPSAPATLPGQPRSSLPEAASRYDRLVNTEDNVRLDEATTDALRGELIEHQDAVRIARTIADFKRGRHELVLGPTLIDTPLPETQAARAVARLLAADAAIRAHDGDLDGALDSCRAALAVGRSIGDEPFDISQLVRAAIGHVALKAAQRTLGQGEPSDEALARFQALALDELAQPLLLHAMRGERAIYTELIRRVGAGELPITALSGESPSGDRRVRRDVIAPWGKLWFDCQRAVALEWMNAAVAIARQPPPARPALWTAWEAEFARVERNPLEMYSAMLPLLLTPGLSAMASADSRYRSELGATVILLAAERHRRKTGEWPATIAAIDPAILLSPPVDPFSGRAFRMERRDGLLIIHSVGPNRKDERGADEPKQWFKGGPDDVGATAWDVCRRRRQPSE